jgi:hypothetical protein
MMEEAERMPTLLAERDREAMVRRLGTLTPLHQRHWGKMMVHQMLCHVSDQMRVALGDLPTRRSGGALSGQIVRFIGIHTPLPWPKGRIQTAPEMLTAKPATWDADMQACEALIARFDRERPAAVHPRFGPLTPREWGILAAKHLDHHFTQFGV